jgi:hypothetical protein
MRCAAPNSGIGLHFRGRRRDPGGQAVKAESEPPFTDAYGARRWTEDGRPHIDVRGLDPPAPLVAILALIRDVGPGRAIVVHHDRDPVFLYPELAEIGWTAERVDSERGEVRLVLAQTT